MKTVRIVIENPTASGHRLGWSKHVTFVDSTKTNGYAFGGKFLNNGEYDLPLGAVVVEKAPSGPANRPSDTGYCYRVAPDGPERLDEGLDWDKQFLTFRDLVADALGAGCTEAKEATVSVLAELTDEELLSECRRRGLLNRSEFEVPEGITEPDAVRR